MIKIIGKEYILNMEKFNKYLSDNNEKSQSMLMKLGSISEAIDYYNIYDDANIKSLSELEFYVGDYGFIYNDIFYHILYDEALDVIENTKNKLKEYTVCCVVQGFATAVIYAASDKEAIEKSMELKHNDFEIDLATIDYDSSHKYREVINEDGKQINI